MRHAAKCSVGGWGLLLVGGGLLVGGCGGGSLPEALTGDAPAQVGHDKESKGPQHEQPSAEVPPNDGPCLDAPPAAAVLAQAERAGEFAKEVDAYLRQLGRPPVPPAPYTVQAAERWIAQVGQPWFDAQAKRIGAFEKRLAEFPDGTYAHARATITVAAAWDYLSNRRTPIPKYAEKNYQVRIAYLGDWPRSHDQPLRDHAGAWGDRARKAASAWGMFQIGVDRFWLTGKASEYLRQPFPPPAPDGFSSPLLPASVQKEVSAPDWPGSVNDVLQLGPFGLTPRQLGCAQRFEGEPRVRHVLGRYYTTRALLFRDVDAAQKAERLLERDDSPAAIVDRSLLIWLEDSAKAEARGYDQARVQAWFEQLPPGDLSRRRLALNLVRAYVSQPPLDDLGPPETALPQAEQRIQRTNFEGWTEHGAPKVAFPWWTPPVSQLPHTGAGRIEGVRADLSDGSHFIIPYSDQGLDYCAMVHIAKNGQRTPHRPPDVRKKCAARWAKEDAK